ncbi:histone aminotransferase 1 [Capsaspora owczarzaki ATCC 30864]|uniref:Histone acetyltransferase type B catalytic subunit n=2 Tax=Capsaspora owczarzaki (strain ATCC 30864) TaxID=595528 RepID=A0A0D2WN46_CAPO3|nr:histone aminotransferase 1 [Capsaspora owczarzaki ATCC 30864]
MTNPALTFHPEFAHQLFGDNERIFGYRNLNIKLFYTASAMHPLFSMTYSEKVVKRKGEAGADDVVKLIGDILPENHARDEATFKQRLSEDAAFVPMGELISSYQREGDDSTFEVYRADCSTQRLAEFHTRIQTFLMWFVDGASFIDLNDNKWTVFLVFKRVANVSADGSNPTRHLFVGYMTTYDFFAYPDRLRPRISQVLVLPPYQKQGHGREMLQAFYRVARSRAEVWDVSVEDPGLAFATLRDRIDARNCLSELPELYESLPDDLSEDIVSQTQQKLKLNKKQIRHIFELLKLNQIDRNDEAQYKKYRLMIKKRLHRQYNTDLVQLEMAADRIKVLDKLYTEIEQYYTDILRAL